MKIRKIVFWGHLVVGLTVGLLVLLMALSGVVISFERQVIESFEGRPVAGGVENRLSLEELHAKVEASGLQGVTALQISSEPGRLVQVIGGKQVVGVMDGVTGEVVEDPAKGARVFFAWVTGFHRWLALEGEWREWGKKLNGVAALGFLVLIVSGVVLWWPKKWSRKNLKAIAVPKWRAKGKVRDWNWHHVFGIWMALPLMISVTTGVVIAYPWASALVFRLAGEEPPAGPPGGGRGGPGGGRGEGRGGGRPGGPGGHGGRVEVAGWEEALRVALAAKPEWQAVNCALPAGGKAVFAVAEGHRGRPDLKTTYTVALAGAELEKVEAWEAQSRGKRWRTWVRWLHTGEALGWLGQGGAAVGAASAALLVLTGFGLSARRWAAWRRRRLVGFKEEPPPVVDRAEA